MIKLDVFIAMEDYEVGNQQMMCGLNMLDGSQNVVM